MNRLLITGCNGMLGSNIISIVKEEYEILGIDKDNRNKGDYKYFDIDITDYEKTREIIRSTNPDCVVHCAALTNVDSCEENYELAEKINCLATKNIVSTLAPTKRFVYISTDSVFNGEKGNYLESDESCPLNNYAKTKLEGEKLVEQTMKNYLIIRTNFFGWNKIKGESFAEWIVRSLRDNKTINMFTDVIFSPHYVGTLVKLIEKLLKLDITGILNLASHDSISKYEFGVDLAKIFNLKEALIKPISVDSFKFKAKRPKNTSLNTKRAESIIGNLPNIQEEINKSYCDKNILCMQNEKK